MGTVPTCSLAGIRRGSTRSRPGWRCFLSESWAGWSSYRVRVRSRLRCWYSPQPKPPPLGTWQAWRSAQWSSRAHSSAGTNWSTTAGQNFSTGRYRRPTGSQCRPRQPTIPRSISGPPLRRLTTLANSFWSGSSTIPTPRSVETARLQTSLGRCPPRRRRWLNGTDSPVKQSSPLATLKPQSQTRFNRVTRTWWSPAVRPMMRPASRRLSG